MTAGITDKGGVAVKARDGNLVGSVGWDKERGFFVGVRAGFTF